MLIFWSDGHRNNTLYAVLDNIFLTILLIIFNVNKAYDVRFIMCELEENRTIYNEDIRVPKQLCTKLPS